MDLMICAIKSLPEKKKGGKKKKGRKEEKKKPLGSHLPELQLHNSSPIFTICTALHPSVGFPMVLPIWKVKY